MVTRKSHPKRFREKTHIHTSQSKAVALKNHSCGWVWVVQEQSRKWLLANQPNQTEEEEEERRVILGGNKREEKLEQLASRSTQYLEAAAAAETPAVLPGPAGGEEAPIDLGGHGAVPARSAA